VRVCGKSIEGGDAVFVEDAKGAEVLEAGVEVLGEGEGVVGIQPAVVGVASFVAGAGGDFRVGEGGGHDF